MTDFKKGIIYGFLICALSYLVINISVTGYRRYVSGDIKYEDKARAIYSIMKDKYTGEIDEDKMYDGIFTGMVYSTADRYSRYITAEEYESFKQETQGNYCGIGAVTVVDIENDTVSIEGVYEGSPAEKAGLQAGDIIKRVDDFEVSYDTYYETIDRIRGKENTKFNITVYRPSADKTFTAELTRANIEAKTVAHSIINDDIGYLRITGFEEITAEQFKNNISKLKDADIKALIIDLRNNPGGLLTTVTEMADEFMSEGVITYTEDKQGKKNYIYAKEGKWDIPVAILVNGNSASASELFTGALKDCGAAKVVGTNTYGKGVVQTTFPFYDGSALKLTTAKYYTPKGVCIDGVGIAPDYVAEANEDYRLPIITNDNAGYDLELDRQLNKAVQVISNK